MYSFQRCPRASLTAIFLRHYSLFFLATSCVCLLGILLLLGLVLWLFLLGEWLLQNLQNFLVRDLILSLELGEIWGSRCSESLQAVLCDR